MYSSLSSRWHWVFLGFAFALGAFFRFYRFGELPPGLYQDEAYNGLDALDILNGARPIYFPANNGREPLYMYLAALSIGALGRIPAAERLPATLMGLLFIPAMYGLGRVLFNPRVGLLAAFITAGNFWAIGLSRIGLRAGSLPFIAALSLLCAAVGWKKRQVWLVALGGALYGLTFYTYLAARLTPVVLMAFLVFWYIAQRPTFPAWQWLVAFALPASLVVVPLVWYLLQHPQDAVGRVEQVSLLSHGLGPLLNNFIRTLGMFVWQGDLNYRHNLPGRPVFDAFLSLAFVGGVGLAAWRGFKGDRAAVLSLLLGGLMLTPTVLSTDAPHYLRAAGALPFVLLLPAIALDWVWARWRGVVVAGLALSLSLTAYEYFGRYAPDPNVGYAYRAAYTELAEQVGNSVQAGRVIYIDRFLWSYPVLPFLVSPHPNVRVFDTEHPPTPISGDAGVAIWPYEDARLALRAFEPGVAISAAAGPLDRGDSDLEPFALYTLYQSQPPPLSTPLARFESGLQLISALPTPTPNGLRLDLMWRGTQSVEQDLQVFVHLGREGEPPLAQSDSPLGGVLLPARWWRPGEVVIETHFLTQPATSDLKLHIGLYNLATGERVPRIDAPGDSVVIQP